jgi:2-desacetyl-2-hydroxyethyl bacteriochlorophyllide A dehydrogenase
MHTVVVQAPGRIEVATVADPVPGPEDVVVAVEACGLCGTDVRIVDGVYPDIQYPLVPGHEVAGRVVDVGRAVTGLAVGDLVAVDPTIACRACEYCRGGRENLCRDLRMVGITSPGGAADYVRVAATQCYLLPPGTGASAGALVEPLACALHGVDRVRYGLTTDVLIHGAGAIGLLVAQVLRRTGVCSLSIVDHRMDRLSAAQVVGATAVATKAELFDRPEGWNLVVDATGSVDAIEDGLTRVRKGGTFLHMGLADEGATARFSPYRIYAEEITVLGAISTRHSFNRARDLLVGGAVDVKSLITHTADLMGYSDALSAFRSGVGLKTLVLPASSTP